MDDSQYVKFVSQKVNKVQWRPSRSSLQEADIFVSGSWENVRNTVNVWSLQTSNDMTDDDIETEKLRCLDRQNVNGDVTAMSFADPETLVIGLGNGDALLMKYDYSSQTVDMLQEWAKVHQICDSGVPCTGVDVSMPDIVTVGEDGTINLLRMGSERLLRKIDKADSCPISAVRYVKSNEVCTVNKMGQLRLWDMRSPRDEPSRIVVSSEVQVALESVDRHPTRPHILAAGGADGCVTTFDTRKDVTPITKLEVHDMEVWEVHFHPTSPDNLFTCSEDGAVRRLDITSELKNQDFVALADNRPPVDVIELLNCQNTSLNSISMSGSRLVCGTDSESLYIVENIL